MGWLAAGLVSEHDHAVITRQPIFMREDKYYNIKYKAMMIRKRAMELVIYFLE